ncbi:MAG: CNP1-like family protein [Azonexus sp.]|nr:CNP1-like family protein [Azonexus sp.]
MKVGLVCVLSIAVAHVAFAADDPFETTPWQESALTLPTPSGTPRLVAFEVSPANPNRFSVDVDALSVGKDGVVRYALYVDTPGGVRNVTYEGIRCETRERRLYAIGHADGSWRPVRDEKWYRVTEYGTSRQYAALYLDYFCPGGVIVGSVAEARNALQKGGHPGNQRWW